MDDPLELGQGGLFASSERAARRIGDYFVRAMLGRGAMGVVYLVESGEGQQLALKLLPEEMSSDEESLTRFAREVEALAILAGHRSIVRVHGAGRTERGVPYYLMDYVEGLNLKQALQAGLAQERALDALERAADALSYAHQRGLLHRDVKPDNIMIDVSGAARLTDFGLARALRQAARSRLTQTGQTLGTPAYMAPEQATSAEDQIGPWTDVWGLGAILYEVLCGRPPYTGVSAIEIFTKLHEGAPLEPPSQVDPAADPALEAVALAALRHDPRQRTRSAEDFLIALRAARRGGERAGGGALLPILAATALLCALGAGGALLHASRRQPGPDPVQLALDEAEAAVQAGELEVGAARLEGLRGSSQRSPAQAARAAELERRLEAAREARAERLSEVRALFAQGETREARALLRPGLPPFAEQAWILALCGDYAAALAAAEEAEPPARARLAAWALDASALAAALGEVEPPARRAALSWELRAFVPALEPAGELPAGGPWARVAAAEAALGRGWVGVAAASLSGAEGSSPAERLALLLSRARTELAQGRAPAALRAVDEALRLPELHPLDRGRAADWRIWLAQLEGGRAPAEALRYAPGGPRARRAAGEVSPWFSALERAWSAARGSEAERVPALLRAAGAPSALAEGSLVAAERWLSARGRAGAPGLWRARVASLAEGREPGWLSESLALGARAAPVSSASALAAWSRLRARWRSGQATPAELPPALAPAPGDPLLQLEAARAEEAVERRALGEVQAARLAGARTEAPATPSGAAARALALAERLEATDPLWDEAWLLTARALLRRLELGPEQQRQARERTLRRALESVLRGLDHQPLLAARTRLARALLGGDEAEAARAAEDLARAAAPLTPAQLEALSLASHAGDVLARDRGATFLGVCGDLPAWAALQVTLGRDPARAAALVPREPTLLLARCLAQPSLGGASQLRALAEVAQGAPELTLLLVELLALEERGPPQLPPSSSEDERGRALLAQALAWTARARRAGQRAAALRASEAAESACALWPDHAGAHLLAALALCELGRRGESLDPSVAREVHFHIDCAQSLQPWSWAPRLVRYGLPGLEEERARRLGDELLAQGFLTRLEPLGRGPNAARLREALEGLRQPLADLALEGAPEEIGMSSYGLAAQAPARGLPNLSVFTRLRTARESVFDSVKGPDQSALEGFLATLEQAQPGEERAGLRARLRAEFHFGRLTQIHGDPLLRGLEGAERAATVESLSARRRLLAAEHVWRARRLRSTLEPFAERLRRVGPYPWEPPPAGEGQPASARRPAFLRAQPGAPTFWKVWLAAWSEGAESRILARAREAEADPDLLSLADLVPQDSLSRSLLGSATQAAGGWATWRLALEGSPEEAALALLRNCAFQRRAPPFLTAYWQLNGLRSKQGGARLDRTKLGLALAARVLSGRAELFELFVGDQQLDLARSLPEEEAEERSGLIAEGARRSAQPLDVPPELESRGSALWRRVRGLALAGELEAAEATYRQLRELDEEELWGLDSGDDPWFERLCEALPALREDTETLRRGGAGGQEDED